MEACYHHLECRMPGNVQHWGRWPTDDAAVVQHDLVRLCRCEAEPTLSFLVDDARGFALWRRDAVVWYGRRCSPVTTALLILCAEARVPWERACRGQLFDSDFPKLTAAAGRVAASQLILCDARCTSSIDSSFSAFAMRQSLSVAIIDWSPGQGQLDSLRELSSRLNVVVVMPAL